MLLHELQEGIALRKGVTVVTGGSAASRVALCRALTEQAPQDTFTSVIVDPIYSERELLARLLRDFGVMSRDQSRVGHRVGVAHTELIEALERFLRGLIPIDATALLVVDKAERLPVQVLQKIATLAGLEDNGRPLLQMVILGTLELDALLRDPALSALKARAGQHYSLPQLVRESENVASAGFFPRGLTLGTAIAVVLLGCVLAVACGIMLYRRIG